MNKIKIIICFWLVAVLLFNFALAERTGKTASAIKKTEAERTKYLPATAEPLSEAKSTSASIQSPANFILVADVLDGFGGESVSPNFKIPVNSGGQSSAIGISASTNYGIKAGYVYSSYVYHGDANANGVIDIGDVVYLINYLFKGGLSPHPMEAGDTNCDWVVDVGDVVYLINYLYKGGPPPVC